MKIKRNQAVLFILLALAALLLAACGGGATATAEATLESGAEAGTDSGAEAEADTSVEAPATGSGLCANPYYPVIEGVSHNYHGVSTDSEFTFTSTISGVREDGFTLTSEFDGVTVTQEWACTAEGLMALTYGGGAAAAVSVTGSEATYETSDVTGVTLPTSIAAGDAWSQTFVISGTQTIPGMEQAATVAGSASTSYAALGEESVDTEAGTFTAMKVAVTHVLDLTVTVNGISTASQFTSTGHTWYVAGIGWVKSVDNAEIAGVAIESAIELTAYSIPE